MPFPENYTTVLQAPASKFPGYASFPFAFGAVQKSCPGNFSFTFGGSCDGLYSLFFTLSNTAAYRLSSETLIKAVSTYFLCFINIFLSDRFCLPARPIYDFAGETARSALSHRRYVDIHVPFCMITEHTWRVI